MPFLPSGSVPPTKSAGPAPAPSSNDASASTMPTRPPVPLGADHAPSQARKFGTSAPGAPSKRPRTKSLGPAPRSATHIARTSTDPYAPMRPPPTEFQLVPFQRAMYQLEADNVSVPSA